MTQADLVSYAGIVAAVVTLVGVAKKLIPAWTKGKEPLFSFGLSIVLGVLSKLTIPGAFATVHWLTHVVTLVGVAFGAKLTHDHLVNEVVKGTVAKTAKLIVVSFLSLSLLACSCKAEQAAVRQLGEQHDKMSVKYLRYVEKDVSLRPEEKKDEEGLVRSIRDLIAALKRSLSD